MVEMNPPLTFTFTRDPNIAIPDVVYHSIREKQAAQNREAITDQMSEVIRIEYDFTPHLEEIANGTLQTTEF